MDNYIAPVELSVEKSQGLSRRSFLNFLAIGAAGTALELSRPHRVFGSETKTPKPESEAGQITLDGLMMTYFSFPQTIGSAKFTFGRHFSTVFTLKLPQTPGLTLTGAVPATDLTLPVGISQQVSSTVANGLILRTQFGRSVGAGAKDSISTKEGQGPLAFFGLSSPRLHIGGTGNNLKFHLSHTSQPSFDMGTQVSSATMASLTSLCAAQGPALTAPRYSWVDLSSKSGASTFDMGLPSTLLSGKVATATVTTQIIKQTGFTSPALQQAFAPGNAVQITYYSAQELPSKSLMDLKIKPYGSDVCRVYIDRVFKTFALAPPPSGSSQG